MNVLARWAAMIALAGLIAGCSDPTANVAEATVGDAQPVPGEAAPAGDEATPPTPGDGVDFALEMPMGDGNVVTVGGQISGGEAVTFDGSNSKIDFVGSKLVGGGHDGGFKQFEGWFGLAPEGGDVATISVTIDMNSLWSDNEKLTGHLKNQDFFEVETYPESEFVTTAIAPAPAGAEGATHEITGNLTMHGTTKSVTFPATVAVTDGAVALDSEFKIDRTLWGIVYGAESDMRDRIINKDVVIRLDIDAPRGADAEAPPPAEATE